MKALQGRFICVYASSSNKLDESYVAAARLLGAQLAKRRYSLIFGGGATGLMGVVARAVHAWPAPTSVVGVLPELFDIPGIYYESCDKLLFTKTMRERKQIMEDSAEGFVALPGGFGTLEELLEIITLKQLKYHSKPIVIINTNGFYDALLAQFSTSIAQNFAKEANEKLYYVTDDPVEAIHYIETYQPPEIDDKWLTHVDAIDSRCQDECVKKE